MKSTHSEEYNHDPYASAYDQDVQREEHPIRAGYAETLKWVVDKANIGERDDVLDLGVGSGNLSAHIDTFRSLTCVDVSRQMMRIAQRKLERFQSVEYYEADILEFVSTSYKMFDVIVSTYTIHHLTEEEKMHFLSFVSERLRPGGRVVFGDLMFEDESAEAVAVESFRERGWQDVAGDIDEEFFWYIDTAVGRLESLGLQVEVQRFSELSWGISAFKPHVD